MLSGVLFSLLAAVLQSLANLMEKRAVDTMPALSARRVSMLGALVLRSRLWCTGFVIGLVALGFQVVAFALAPISVVQSIAGGGLVLLVLASKLIIGEELVYGEWIGLVLIVGSLLLVTASLGSTDIVGVGGSVSVVVLVATGTAVTTLVLFGTVMRRSGSSVVYGVVSGFLYGVASLGTKGASVIVRRSGIVAAVPRILESPYPYVFIVASILGLIVFQIGIQRGRIAVVSPVQGAIASAYVVIAGMIIFHEPFPSQAGFAALRIAGIAGVVVGTLLLGGLGAGARVYRLARLHSCGRSAAETVDPVDIHRP